jgi:phosphoglycolate phosphatase-like HAD superfamily hydrolase
MHAIVFDLDGTLLQSAEVDDTLYRDSVRTVLGDVRFRSCPAEYDYVTDSGILSQILEDNLIPDNPNCIAAVKSTFLKAFQTYFDRNGAFPEIPGAKALLEALRLSHDYSVAIATGGWRDTATLKLQTSGFDLAELPMAHRMIHTTELRS